MTPEPACEVGDLAIVRWRSRDLPPGLSKLIEEALAGGVAWMADFRSEWNERPFLADGEALFLALESSRPVAMAVISADPHVVSRDVGRLRYIYVADAVRGRGLLRVFVDLCLARGATRWRRLRLHTDNPVAARIYEQHGFRSVTDENNSTHVRDDQDAFAGAGSAAA